ncbi:MAG: hypothetical protein HY980_03895 [Candidatus Magasanikbacteria bacterium]|nr:hypothetical protein [Candidatus Magasanikbacteria bacterium]
MDLSGVHIPDNPGGFGWVVFVIKELTCNRVYTKCSELFASSSWYGNDLDSAINKKKEECAADNGPYAVRFRNRVEPDDENKNLSADTLAERHAQDVTLLEAMLLELWYYWRTGGSHTTFVNWCLCAGSRYRLGGVPCVSRRVDEFRVGRCLPGSADGDVRARSAVR